MKMRSLLYNSFFNIIYKVLNIVFPLATAAYIARILSTDLIGEVNYAQNIVQYFVLLSALGIPNYGTREMAKNRENLITANKIFSDLFAINFVSTGFSLVIYFGFVLFIASFREQSVLYLFTGLSIVFNFFNVDWAYTAFEQYKYIAVRSLIIKIVSFVAVLLFVRKSEDYLVYSLLCAISLGSNNIINVIYLRKLGIKLSIKKVNIRKHFLPIFYLFLTTIAIELYTLLDTTMIGIWCTKDNVAYYNNAIRITKSIIAAVAAIGGVLLPRLSFYLKNNDMASCSEVVRKILNLFIYIFLPSIVGLSLCADEIIIVLYGDSFLPSVTILRISSLLILSLGFSNLFGTQILITFGFEKKLLIATIIGAVSNMIMNFLLIRHYQGIGAVIASVVSEFLVTTITFFGARKCIKISTDIRNFIISFAASCVLIVEIFVLKQTIKNSVLLLVMEIGIGVVTYALLTIAMKNIVAIDIYTRLRKIIKR